MSPDIDRHPSHDELAPETSWRIGRSWASVVFALVAASNLVTVVIDLTDGDDEAAGGPWSLWLRIAVVVFAIVAAVSELRRRVEVDADGVHLGEAFRRRSYPWQDISEVRMGRPSAFSDSFVYLLRHQAKHVELPASGGHLRLLQRWHGAMSGT